VPSLKSQLNEFAGQLNDLSLQKGARQLLLSPNYIELSSDKERIRRALKPLRGHYNIEAQELGGRQVSVAKLSGRLSVGQLGTVEYVTLDREIKEKEVSEQGGTLSYDFFTDLFSRLRNLRSDPELQGVAFYYGYFTDLIPRLKNLGFDPDPTQYDYHQTLSVPLGSRQLIFTDQTVSTVLARQEAANSHD
jgi:hypothetical protein